MNRKRQLPLLAVLAVLASFICGFALAWALGAPVAQIGRSDAAPTARLSDPDPDPGPDPEPSTGIVVSGDTATDPVTGAAVARDGTYTSRDEVALYIHAFGDVPGNYITKSRARRQGWVASEGNLWDVCPGMSIGGGGFENIEDELPVDYDPDRTWKECDIGYEGGYRGPERLVYSDDGYIFYTGDHYETFTQLFPREEV